MDGLLYEANGTVVVVTTPALFRHWITDHNRWWSGEGDIPQPAASAVRSEQFWTYAIFDDARAYVFGEAPVAGADELSSVQLVFRSNGGAVGADPDTLVASVARGNRVFVAQQKLSWSIMPIPVCRSTLKQAPGKFGSEDQADRDYRACFAAHLREQPHYTEMVHQAQALVDLLH